MVEFGRFCIFSLAPVTVPLPPNPSTPASILARDTHPHSHVQCQGQYSPTLGNFEYTVQPSFDQDFSWADCPLKCPPPFFGNDTGKIANTVPCLPDELRKEELRCCRSGSEDWPDCQKWPGEGRRESKFNLTGSNQLNSTCNGPCPEVCVA